MLLVHAVDAAPPLVTAVGAVLPVVGRQWLRASEGYDLWRKSMLPNLIAGREWSTASGTHSKETKVRLLLAVLNVRVRPSPTAEHRPGRRGVRHQARFSVRIVTCG